MEERDFRVLSRIRLFYCQAKIPTFTISICQIPGSWVTLNAHFNEAQYSQYDIKMHVALSTGLLKVN